MISGSCHCGAVRIAVPHAPDSVASCNCSICRRTGALMAYYRPADVRVEGDTATYVTGDRLILFHHCPACACHTHWSANGQALAGDLPDELRELLATRMGVNARLLDGFAVTPAGPAFDGRPLEVRFHDNAG